MTAARGMRERLTVRQREALERLATAPPGGRACTSWVSRYAASSAPTYRALRSLERKGLVGREQAFYWPYWWLTDAGRAAIDTLREGRG